ncbi:MAG: acetyl/propionyl/methylcrotonyl-CoA carboxylase subunit alpha [Thermoanaerobaculia bacterium]
MIRRLLIANRGEIAVRIARTAREMGISPVGVFAESDAGGFHLRTMERIVSLGPGPPSDTYLSIPRLLEAAQSGGADAVHPGYGFLSENAAFARAVELAGLTWVGPSAEAIDEMGDKLRARARMAAAGVPVVPGSAESVASDSRMLDQARQIGWPVLVKAAAGGGGKGMLRVNREEELFPALAEARRVAGAAFGDESLYLEKFFDRPRHIEFQIFGDAAGSVLHLFDRECSVQRRHQKIVEETPSPALDAPLRRRMGEAAVEAARAVRYVGAGTVEFLLDDRRNFYFLEMNTRLQVEHPITEETLGIDLVRSQLEVAGGGRIPDGWARLTPRGHAIEARLYAEDPVEFLPRSGEILDYVEPSGPGIRVDSGVARGSRVGLEYDPLLAKLVSAAPDRPAAIQRMLRAAKDWVVLGVETNLPLLRAVLESDSFGSGRYATDLVPSLLLDGPPAPPPAAWIAAALAMAASSPAETGPAGPPDPWNEPSGWRGGA